MKLAIYTKKVCFLTIALSFISYKTEFFNHQNKTHYINTIDSLMRASFEKNQFNGNVLVVKNDSIIYQKSFGYTDAKQEVKLNEKSIFNIGSIAKEFNGVAIRMLQERGLLNINDTISKFNLGLPNWSKKITIKHLLNYASGIPRIDYLTTTSDEVAWKILRKSDTLLFEPGTRFYYDNSNVFLQRRIIEKVTGRSFEEFITENIVHPLKMTNSVFDPVKKYPNRTSCYGADKVSCPELEFISGWLWTDINDLHKWVKAINSNILISQESFNILLKNPYVKNKASSLGEYFEQYDLQRHNGVSLQFESILLNDFKNDLTIILLSNHRDKVLHLGHSIHNILLNKPYKSVYEAIRNKCIDNVDSGIEAYKTLKENRRNEYIFDHPNELNKLGYELLRMNKKQNAIKIFLLATSEFPKNANSHDSLGEGYFINEQYELSLLSYQKVLEIDGQHENAKKMIEKINIILKK